MNISRRYLTFVIVGVVVTAATVAFRAVLGRVVGDESQTLYALSIIAAYVFGIALSYVLHRSITFKQSTSAPRKSIVKFVLVQLVGMQATVGLSVLLRWAFGLGLTSPEFVKSAAFAMAALATSLLTYTLNARFVFAGSSKQEALVP
jgi:putative flippase GtrA